ncbi:MAG: hypothetical protein FJY95_06145 [Candidatus Handelsmanbacteria bacterium]|nr:hypothetical protein [Candidatus Handelsmanbacteria bacterium]
MRTGIPHLALLLALLAWGEARPVAGAACASPKQAAAQAKLPSIGRLRALALFGRFADQADPGPPAFASRLFDPELPGSLTHFYREMS